jgi:GTP-binding protein LepA
MSAWNERNPSNRLGFIKSAFEMHSTAPSAESASSVPSSMQKESSPSTKTFVYDAKKIRNFSIIAHIDHGKSTLADRLLEATQTVHARDMQNQLLDNLDIERERGITIKLQAARMIYHAKDGENYLLNLIDTPGHVDFGYEVSRSLAACEGALVVVDASQGVEAQTVANVYLALENNLEIFPVINKIDLPAADPIAVKSEIESTIGLDCTDAIAASAKTGVGIENILEAVVNRLPPPLNANSSAPLQALIFDSYYDAYRGVVVFFRVVQGSIQRGDKIKFMNSGMEYEVLEVGVMTPTKLKVDVLRAGEVGYLAANIKAVDHARVGDTITLSKYMPQQGSSHSNLPTVKPLPGYAPAKQMVFAGLYPSNSDDYEALRDAIAKLKLNDAAFSYFPETSQAMGFGFRCGFLGLLHMDIIQERLEREYDLDLIITAPSVVYKVLLNKSKKKSAVVTNASGGHTLYEQNARSDSSAATSQHSSRDAETVDSDEWLEHKAAEKEKGHQNEDELYDVMYVDTPSKMPDPAEYVAIQEPYVRLEMFCPSEYTGTLMDLAQTRRGISKELKYSSPTRATLIYEIPLAEVITNFFDQLKSRTKGYASMSFIDIGFRTNQLVRLDIRINGEDAAPLATIVHRDKAYDVGKKICLKLKELIPRQQFRVPIQAMIGNKPVASAHISAVMKDVLAKCYGGDISRKKKLLQKQARGKKRMKTLGKVNVPQEAFMAVIRLDDDNNGNNSS